ncbi:hypothetical protein FRACYDRAFT_232001 [Fragilariopsis cylindrus CCMP1102]|uniref:RNI-like protein n=1 Tax=Fragilariopsis cylindrus CCMP1102 TaxID=635003 RepID=A0A1E7FUL9_9STRA|nr:hypothetical protein FRACYDRAFT_232001 [Fragilariopsis cylindrus CCMP1102]|eukprot:OEU21856.1 hypothetical protein FRACYDRAFT_232001 [Fragilariopsis cylindrus CCMP1102]
MESIGFDYNHQIRYHLKDIGKGKELKGITLTRTKITDSNIPELVEAVQKTNITTLALTLVKIGPAGVRALLPLTTQLTELRLSGNRRIGDAGAKILAAALKKIQIAPSRHWTCLDLRYARRAPGRSLTPYQTALD